MYTEPNAKLEAGGDLRYCRGEYHRHIGVVFGSCMLTDGTPLILASERKGGENWFYGG